MLAQYRKQQLGELDVFQRLTGPGQLWWRRCAEAARLPASRLTQREADAALHVIRRCESPELHGTTADAAAAALTVSRALSGDESGEPVTSAAASWDSDGPGMPMARDGAPAPFAKALAYVPPDMQGRAREVLASLGSPVRSRGQAMIMISALLLAGARLDTHPAIWIPVVLATQGQDGNGARGVAGMLEVRELPGGPGGLFPDPSALRIQQTNDSFDQALRLAWEYAAGDRHAGRCALWRLVLDAPVPDYAIEGGSLGAAFAVALQELLSGHPAARVDLVGRLRGAFLRLRPDCAITGELSAQRPVFYIEISPRDKPPWLDAVGAMDAKLKAAEARQWRLVAPTANRVNYESSAPVPVYWAKTVRQADRYARRARPLRVIGAAAAAVVLAVGLAAGVFVTSSDNAAHQQRDATIASQLVSESEAAGDANPAASRVESIAAWAVDPSAQARYAMLRAASSPEIATLPAGFGPVNSVAYSRNGKLLATGYGNGNLADGTATVWNSAGQPIRTLHPGSGGVNSVAFSPDGKLLATGGNDSEKCGGTTELWSVATGKPTGLPIPVLCGVNAVAFSPDGKILATGGEDSGTQLWNVSTGRLISTLERFHGLSDMTSSVAFSPDGTLLAAGSSDGSAALYSVATGKLVRSLSAGPYLMKAVSSVAFSLDGKLLATGTSGGQAVVWNVSAGGKVSTINTGSESVNAVAFGPDAATLATGDDSGTAVWNLASGGQVGNLAPALGPVNSVAFGPAGVLATGDNDGTVRLWDGASGQLRSLPTDDTIPTGQGAPHHLGSLYNADAVAFSPDGTMLAGGGGDADSDTAELWNVTSGARTRSLPSEFSGVYSLTFNPAGTMLVTGGNVNPRSSARFHGRAEVWSMGTGQLIRNMYSVSPVNSVAVDRTGAILATGVSDGTAGLWNLATGRAIRTLRTDSNAVYSVAFSPDGTILATGGDDTATLWDVATGQQIRVLPTGTEVNSVAFSPDGKTVATGDGDGRADLWNVASGQQASSLDTGADSVKAIAFNPDGNTLAVAGAGTIYLYDLGSGQPVSTLDTGSPYVNALAFSLDGATLAASYGTIGGIDDFVTLWNTNFLTNPLASACSQIGGSLTPAEWSQYVPSGPGYRDACPRRS